MESLALLSAKPGLTLRAGPRLPLPRLRATRASTSLSSTSSPAALHSPLLASRARTSHDAVLGYGLLKRRPTPTTTISCTAAAAAAPPAQPEPKKFLGVGLPTLKKIIPLGLMFFCILFNYTILRDTKDVLVVTAKGSSAEIIPFLKTWVNLPMAIGFMLAYSKLSDVLSREALFYTVIFPFIAFFGLFGFVLYPLRDLIHPTALADRLLAALGPSFLGPVAILRIWSFCLFYVMAELWGSVVVSVLFWGFANQVSHPLSIFPLNCASGNHVLHFLQAYSSFDHP
jgi:AAA family ATP:ADP antiporter